MIDFGLYLTYALFIGAVSVAVLLPVFSLLKNPKELMKVGMVLAGFVVLFIIFYSMSSSAVTPKYTALGVTENGVKMIGAGLTFLYVFLIVSVVGIVYSEINKALK